MRVKRSDQITRSAIAYLQSVNGYFKSRYAKYFPWNVTVAMLHLYVLDELNFFLSQMHFLQVFNASDVVAAPHSYLTNSLATCDLILYTHWLINFVEFSENFDNS